MLKKILVTSLLLSSTFGYGAETEKFCNDIEKVSKEGFGFNQSVDQSSSEMCLTKKHGKIILTENSYIYGENKYELINAPEKFIENVKRIENISGKLIIITKNNDLYTSNLGYVLTNDDYLALKNNNKISIFKEDISNVKKVVYSDITLVLDNDNKTFIKTEKGKWERAPFKKAIDIAYSNYGSYFVLTKKGIFSKLKERDLQKSGYKGKGSLYRFDRAGIGRIPLSDLRFDFIENSNDSELLKIVFSNNKNKNTYEAYLFGSKVFFDKKPNVQSKRAAIRIDNIIHSKKIKNVEAEKSLPIVSANDLTIKDFDQKTKNHVNKMETASLSTNILSTKYNENILVPYKEEIDLTDRTHKWLKPYLLGYSEKIVSIKEDVHKEWVYVLRSNGLLKVFDKKTLKKVSEDTEVKNIIKDNYSEQIKVIK